MNKSVAKSRVKVFITVDTEVWPHVLNWPRVPLVKGYDPTRSLNSYFWGGEVEPKLGLPFQLATLAQYGLKATYFVDPIFSYALGSGALKSVVSHIQDFGQEVGLHMHPEWLNDCQSGTLPGFRGPFMHNYPLQDQTRLISAGLDRLRAIGAAKVDSFRAGNWGANIDTLRALSHSGIRFDSSLNACFAVSFPDLSNRASLRYPSKIEGVWEVPLTSFLDRPNHHRPLAVCACSLSEFRHALDQAYLAGWTSVAIVTHSFEFVRVNRLERRNRAVGPRQLLGHRFKALCEFLSINKDRFETAHFCDLPALPFAASDANGPIKSNVSRTLARYVSQAVSLVY